MSTSYSGATRGVRSRHLGWGKVVFRFAVIISGWASSYGGPLAPTCAYADYSSLPFIVTQTVLTTCSMNQRSLSYSIPSAVLGSESSVSAAVTIKCTAPEAASFSLTWSQGQDLGGGEWDFGTGRVRALMCDDASGSNCCPPTGAACSKVFGPTGLSSASLTLHYTASSVGPFSMHGTLVVATP